MCFAQIGGVSHQQLLFIPSQMERTKLARPARLNNSILVKLADVADDVFHHQDKNKEIK